jgi:hypothetical protein
MQISKVKESILLTSILDTQLSPTFWSVTEKLQEKSVASSKKPRGKVDIRLLNIHDYELQKHPLNITPTRFINNFQ